VRQVAREKQVELISILAIVKRGASNRFTSRLVNTNPQSSLDTLPNQLVFLFKSVVEFDENINNSVTAD